MRKRLAGLLQTNVIFLGGLGVCCVLLAAGLVLIVPRSVILHRLVLPFAVVFLSPDGIIEENTVRLINGLMGRTGSVAVVLAAVGAALVCYAFIWRFFSLRLPELACAIAPRPMPPVSMSEACLVLGATVTALVVRIPAMGRGLIYDEVVTASLFVEVDSWWTTVATHFRGNNHIACSVLARLSEGVFGRHEWALRLPSLLLGIGSICLLWFVARKLVSRKVAVAATWCLALAPAHVAWSVSARGYAGMILFTLLSSYLYFELLDRPTRGKGLVFFLSSVVAIFFHVWAISVTVVQLLYVVYLGSRELLASKGGRWLHLHAFRTLWLAFPGIATLSAVGYVPAFFQAMTHFKGKSQAPFQPLLPGSVIHYLSGTNLVPLGTLVFLGVVLGLITLRKPRPREVGYSILVFLIPVALAWFADPTLRYFVYLLPYYVVLAVVGFCTLWRLAGRRHGVVSNCFKAALTLLVVVVLSTWVTNSWNSMPRSRARDAVQAMLAGATDQAGLCAIGGGARWFQYYSEREITVPRTLEEFREMTDRYPEVRCVYRPRAWEPPEHTVIAEILGQGGTSQEFGGIVVFTYRR